jgi:hypothetical protein
MNTLTAKNENCTKIAPLSKQTADILTREVSVFPNVRKQFETHPTTIGDWLRACMDSSNSNMQLIERIRATADKNQRAPLKLLLPGVTMGALMHHRAANRPDGTKYTDEDKIIALSGLLAFDIDAKENPGMIPAKMREKLSNVRNVIFCGLSASGEGVWGLIEVADPAKIKQHYDQLKVDFKLLGIELDASKGGNPTDVRFYSYDPDAYLAETYKVYTRLPQAKPTPPKHHRPTMGTSASDNGLQTAIKMIERAPDGQKHFELIKAAHLAGGYIARGLLIETEAKAALLATVKNKGNVQSLKNAEKTIADGIAHGKTMPVDFKNNTRPTYKKRMFPVVRSAKKIEAKAGTLESNAIADSVPTEASLMGSAYYLLTHTEPDCSMTDRNGHTMPLHDWINQTVAAACLGCKQSVKEIVAFYNTISKQQHYETT